MSVAFEFEDYDLAGRVAGIYHETTTPEPILSLEYVWSRDGLVEQVTETDADGVAFITEYYYDQRNRLVEEFRYPVVPGPMSYHFRYTYDKAGNRLLKEDLLAGVNTGYTYDVQDPERYGSQGNRLVESRRYIAATDETLESRIYLYDKAGRVTQLVRTIAGDVDPEHDDAQWHRGTEFWYNTRGQLWMARSARWQLEGEEQPGGGVATRVVNAEYLSAMEYRYDSGRRRYMTRRCDPGSMAPLTAEASWHDYLGDSIHADHAVDYEPGQSPAVAEKAAHVPGVARYDHSLPAGDRVRQLFGNLIGTTEAECDDEGTVTGRTMYTAFGEVVGTTGNPTSRYGYAGAWGYQSAGRSVCGVDGEEFACDPLAELGWLHVGERYYDPQSGRFVQRDPIGIRGGFNTYLYLLNQPTSAVDPLGLMPLWVANAILTLTGGSSRNVLDDRALMDGIGEGAFYVGAGAAVLATGGAAATIAAPGSSVAGLCTMPIGAATAASATPLTVHGTERLAQRGWTPDRINQVINEADAAIAGIGRYGTTVVHFVKGNAHVIMETGGRNAGKVITVFP